MKEKTSATRSTTETLIAALRVLSRDIQSEDGLANAAIAEAADRLQELLTMTRGLVEIMERSDIEEFPVTAPVTNTEWFVAIAAAKEVT